MFSSKVFKVYTGLFLLLFLVGFISINADEEKAGNKEIIKFSHEVHTSATECADCHTSVSGAESLNDRLLPNKADCETCHSDWLEDSEYCEKCHYPDVMTKLVQNPSLLIFNHKAHIEEGAKCESCHKDIAGTGYSYSKSSFNPAMEDCYTCHNSDKGPTQTCESCHKTTDNLIPENHRNVNFVSSHKFHATGKDANCMMCHDDQSCENCHLATTGITEKNTKTDFFMPYSPANSANKAKIQKITQVHELNYRFLHSIDAKSKSSECITCHQVETFCVQCHAGNNEDYALSGVMPASHLKPDFKTIGVGSGGGLHATLARRDIERCQSCHDVQGGDPTCILCHSDPDGIKNTNPKTHAKNYLQNFDGGDWHSDQASVCYTCHTDANARPNGIAGTNFCGYCHGIK
ncbi:MAG: cytochrome C [Ignavibacteriaceae bacterium]|nr:cytochrome C [Ignavibacteriaceae bacterium]